MAGFVQLMARTTEGREKVGLFSRKSAAPPLDETLLPYVAVAESDMQYMRFQLAQHQDVLRGVLGPLEKIVLIAWDHWGYLLVVTEYRTILLNKRGIHKEIVHADVAETEIIQRKQDLIIRVESRQARDDFLPSDLRRNAFIMTIMVLTPGQARFICGAIDKYVMP